MAVNTVGYKAELDTSDVDKKLQGIGDSAKGAAGEMGDAFGEAGNAADAAMEEIADGAKGASSGIEQVTLNVKQADESLAAAAINATDFRRRLSDASKELSEGLSRATEIAVKTGDMKDAAIAFAEGGVQGGNGDQSDGRGSGDGRHPRGQDDEGTLEIVRRSQGGKGRHEHRRAREGSIPAQRRCSHGV